LHVEDVIVLAPLPKALNVLGRFYLVNMGNVLGCYILAGLPANRTPQLVYKPLNVFGEATSALAQYFTENLLLPFVKPGL
jgi:hypothetical protein